MSKEEDRINELKNDLRDMDKLSRFRDALLGDLHDENRRLRDACRQTNKGITRLRKRCDNQTKKIAEFRQLLVASIRAMETAGVSVELRIDIDEAINGRRVPAEKAT